MQPPTQSPSPEHPDTSEVPSVVTRAASYVARTVSRPPWVGLILLCVGSVIFELTLFALLPLTEGTRELLSMRLLLILIAATPALAAVAVAVAANRKSPLVPRIDYPTARTTGGEPLRSSDERWREYHN